MPQHLIVMLHGVREDRAEAIEWMGALGRRLAAVVEGARVVPFIYGWTAATSVRLPLIGGFVRRGLVRRFQGFVTRLLAQGDPTAAVDVVAYSFGTWIAQESMTFAPGPKLFFRWLVYMGGIVSSRDDFADEAGHFERVLNVHSRGDDVVRLAPFGHCGYRGFVRAPKDRVGNVDLTPLNHRDYQRDGLAWDEVVEFLSSS